MKLFNGRKHLSRQVQWLEEARCLYIHSILREDPTGQYNYHEYTCCNEERFKYVLLGPLALVFEKAKVKTHFNVSDTSDNDPQPQDI